MGDLIGGFFGYKAAKEQSKGYQRGLDLQEKMYNQSREDMMPWLDAGRRSLADLEKELGSSYEASEGYKWAVEQGEKGVLSNLSALGMTNSGSALKRLTDYRMGMASQDYGTWYNRKAGLAGAGQTQSSNLASLGQNFANSSAQLYAGQGAARGSGYAALGKGIGNTVNSLFGFAGYGGGGGGAGGGGGSLPMNPIGRYY